jgi:hypothetical protein
VTHKLFYFLTLIKCLEPYLLLRKYLVTLSTPNPTYLDIFYLYLNHQFQILKRRESALVSDVDWRLSTCSLGGTRRSISVLAAASTTSTRSRTTLRTLTVTTRRSVGSVATLWSVFTRDGCKSLLNLKSSLGGLFLDFAFLGVGLWLRGRTFFPTKKTSSSSFFFRAVAFFHCDSSAP